MASPSWTTFSISVGNARALVHRGRFFRSGASRVLLLHGNPGASSDWVPLATQCDSVDECLAIDFPGFAGVPRAHGERGASLHNLAELAVAAAEKAAWTNYDVWGHSHGAAVAMALSVAAPNRAKRLVLFGGLGAKPHAAYRQLALPGLLKFASFSLRFLQSRTGKRFTREILTSLAKKASYPHAVPRGWLDGLHRQFDEHPETLLSMIELAKGDPCAEVRRLNALIEVPVTFFHGAVDRIVPLSRSRELHEQRIALGLPSRLELVPCAGHLALLTHISDTLTLMANAYSAEEPNIA